MNASCHHRLPLPVADGAVHDSHHQNVPTDHCKFLYTFPCSAKETTQPEPDDNVWNQLKCSQVGLRTQCLPQIIAGWSEYAPEYYPMRMPHGVHPQSQQPTGFGRQAGDPQYRNRCRAKIDYNSASTNPRRTKFSPPRYFVCLQI